MRQHHVQLKAIEYRPKAIRTSAVAIQIGDQEWNLREVEVPAMVRKLWQKGNQGVQKRSQQSGHFTTNFGLTSGITVIRRKKLFLSRWCYIDRQNVYLHNVFPFHLPSGSLAQENVFSKHNHLLLTRPFRIKTHDRPVTVTWRYKALWISAPLQPLIAPWRLMPDTPSKRSSLRAYWPLKCLLISALFILNQIICLCIGSSSLIRGSDLIQVNGSRLIGS